MGGWKKAEYHCGNCKAKKLYAERNCKRHFPELVQIGRRPAWIPRVKSGSNHVAVGSYATPECPTSFITAESVWILEMTDTNGLAHRDGGATLFGPDSRKWPAWWMDALAVVAGAKAEYERAEYEASSK